MAKSLPKVHATSSRPFDKRVIESLPGAWHCACAEAPEARCWRAWRPGSWRWTLVWSQARLKQGRQPCQPGRVELVGPGFLEWPVLALLGPACRPQPGWDVSEALHPHHTVQVILGQMLCRGQSRAPGTQGGKGGCGHRQKESAIYMRFPSQRGGNTQV